MNKIRDFLKNNKKYTAIILAIIGLLLIGISKLPEQNTAKNTDSETQYVQNLEKRTQEIIESVAGKNTTKVMITLKNTYVPAVQNTDEFSFDKVKSSKSYESIPMPDIAGVMIVCKSLDNSDDFSTIKQAVSTCLDIPQKKIYIIGGKSDNEKNT